jgi:uncharacterized repeat protein (TIGR01451 family)
MVSLFRPAVLAAAALALLLGSVSAQRASAAFPGGNGELAYAGGVGTYGIWVMNPNGTGTTQLTTNRDFGPAWSADGQKIAFGADYDDDIAVMNADGTGVTQLTGNNIDGGPTWSPDGTKIAFARQEPSTAVEIEVMNANGTGVKALTPGTSPAWSPDGKVIAFSGWGTCGIFTILASGNSRSPKRLTTGCGDAEPDWSPDGGRIVYSTTSGLAVMNADGTAQAPITSDFQDGSPAWSPDGSQIAFTRPVDGHQQIVVMYPSGSGQTQVTFDPTEHVDVAWQPTPVTLADLLLRLKVRSRVCPSCPIRYSIKVWNKGPSPADDVSFSDPLPAGTSFDSVRSSQGSCSAPSPASSAVTCSLGSLARGARVVIIVVCRATGEGTITNTASVTSSTRDPDPGNNTAVAVTEVR